MPEWLARGYAGEMNYLRDPRRADPRLLLDGARSLIVVAINYNSPPSYSTELPVTRGDEVPRGWISRYAWGDDYHEVLREKLESSLRPCAQEFAEPFEVRAYVDTGPIIERLAAKYAGLGWLAKNTCLINEKIGSWLIPRRDYHYPRFRAVHSVRSSACTPIFAEIAGCASTLARRKRFRRLTFLTQPGVFHI